MLSVKCISRFVAEDLPLYANVLLFLSTSLPSSTTGGSTRSGKLSNRKNTFSRTQHLRSRSRYLRRCAAIKPGKRRSTVPTKQAIDKGYMA